MTAITDLPTRLARALEENSGAAAMRLLLRPIVRIIADGRPAAADEVAEVVGAPKAQVAELVRQLPNVELDDHGRVLGLGLTLIPTPHRVHLPARLHTLYVWCVPDVLVLPSILGLPARLVSPCHTTKEPITVDLGLEGVDQVTPPEAVVSWWPDAVNSSDIRNSSCVNQNLFRSAEAAAPWLAARPGATVMPVGEARDVTLRAMKEFGLL